MSSAEKKTSEGNSWQLPKINWPSFGNSGGEKTSTPAQGQVARASIDGNAEEVDALVVGSGISGSTCAYYLDKQGVNVMMCEARDVIGGNLISKTNDEGWSAYKILRLTCTHAQCECINFLFYSILFYSILSYLSASL